MTVFVYFEQISRLLINADHLLVDLKDLDFVDLHGAYIPTKMNCKSKLIFHSMCFVF